MRHRVVSSELVYNYCWLKRKILIEALKLRKGIYAAKVYEGRYVHKQPPFGYKKAGVGKDRHLVIIKTEAEIVEFIYDSYLRNVPMYMIEKAVYEMGFNRKGNVTVERVLKNPIYAGLLSVVTYKDLPGGLFPGAHKAIIERDVWEATQDKIRRKKPKQTRTILDEKLPLRGVVKCHCGTPLTGAPSRGKSGYKQDLRKGYFITKEGVNSVVV